MVASNSAFFSKVRVPMGTPSLPGSKAINTYKNTLTCKSSVFIHQDPLGCPFWGSVTKCAGSGSNPSSR